MAATDTYDFRGRDYRSKTGTFFTLDPYRGNLKDPQSLHKYLFVHGDPLNGIDPTGESLVSQAVTIGIVSGLAAMTVAGIAEALHPDSTAGSILGAMALGFGGGFFMGLMGGALIVAVPALGTAGVAGGLAWAFGFTAYFGLTAWATSVASNRAMKEGKPIKATAIAMMGSISTMLFLISIPSTIPTKAIVPIRQGDTANKIAARLPLGHSGTVARNQLEPHEFAFAEEVVAHRGGHFAGPQLRYQPGIDGMIDGLPASLKETMSTSPSAVLRYASEAESQAAAAGYRGVEVFIKAPNVRSDVLLDFAQNGPLVQIPFQGTVQRITVQTADGWVILAGP